MTTELSTIDQNLIDEINQQTNFQQSIPVPPQIKFDANNGFFEVEAGKDADGKPEYARLGSSLKLHIVNQRAMLVSKFGDDNKMYTRESLGRVFDLYQENNLIMSGSSKDIKAKYPTMKYIKVLYVFNNGKAYRMKIGGSKLSSLFDYFSRYEGSNPALYETIAERGRRLKQTADQKIVEASKADIAEYEKSLDNREKPKLNLFYEIVFKQGEPIKDFQLIKKRIKLINDYLNMFNELRDKAKQEEPAYLPEPHEQIDNDEIKIDDIPF